MSAKKHNLSTHGMYKHRLYKVWKMMLSRTSHAAFPAYHGRGILVCERWQWFPNFAEDMDATFQAGLELDRIDVNGNYEPGNCRWVSHQDNCRNKTNTAFVTIKGETLPFMLAVERYGKAHSETIRARLKKGCSVDEAFSTPKTNKRGCRISVDGVIYQSMIAAATALGVSRSAIYNRMKHCTHGKVFYVEDDSNDSR